MAINGWHICTYAPKLSQSTFMKEGEKYFFVNSSFLKENGEMCEYSKSLATVEEFNRGYKTQIRKVEKKMIKFNYELVVRADVAVRCSNDYEVDTLFDWADSVGLRWASEERYTNARMRRLINVESGDDFIFLGRGQHGGCDSEDTIVSWEDALVQQDIEVTHKKGGEKMSKKVGITGAGVAGAVLNSIIGEDNLVFTHKGVGIKSNGRILAYNNGTITSLREEMVLDKIDMFIKLPCSIGNLKAGDLILQQDEYFFIREVTEDSVIVANVSDGKLETLFPRIDLFGNSVYTKIYSAIEIMGIYDVLRKHDSKYIAIVSALYKNKNNIRQYIEENAMELVAPFVASKDFKIPKVIKDNKKALMIAGGAIALLYNNKDMIPFDKKPTKKQIVLITSVIGAILISAGYKKGWFNKIHDKLRIAAIVAKAKGIFSIFKKA